MTFRIKGSHIVALAICAGIGGWMYNGQLITSGQGDPSGELKTIAERSAENASDLFKVRYVALYPELRSERIHVRGRTKANAIVTIRSETVGIVKKRLVNKGQVVQKGDLVCVIERGAREAKLAQAKAQLAQAEGDHAANSALAKRGFASKTKLNQMKFALDAAKASLIQAEIDIARTEIHANASGIVQDPIVEVGEMLTIGGACVTLIDNDPMLFVGQVSEREIGKVKLGMKANVVLVSGEKVSGKIRYIAASSDAQTRTFQIEIELPNSDRTIRDGLTASASVELPPELAYRLSPSWVGLADNGEIGISALNDDDTVRFVPVKILARTKDGFWVSGPSEGMRIISLGREYVGDGEKVMPVADKVASAEVQQ
ncbi:MAG: efflux transporter periplasmic adaptor subunit [Hyphomicrobiales bacterium]|nr:MAG: efflux transporter periplasmic adaptor subunit [Hyphomicrobiales bacterium]